MAEAKLNPSNQRIYRIEFHFETIKRTLTLQSYRPATLYGMKDLSGRRTMLYGKPLPRLANSPSRRLTSRVPVPSGVWVYWQCQGREDVSQVRDMSMGGLFIETNLVKAEGVLARLNFLVQEGQIRADA